MMDLLILNIGKNSLLKNNGNGTFTDVSNESGMNADNNWSLSASMADYDGDGLLDIYVANFIDYEKAAKVFERSSGFLDTIEADFDPALYSSQSNNLYRNTGGLTFTDKAITHGVADTTGRGKAVRWLDINDDQLPDLIVLNSGGSPNQLYLNHRNSAGFKTNSSVYHVESAVGSHSATSGDIDNDGVIDMIFSRPSGTPPMLLMNSGSPIHGGGGSHRGYEDISWERGLAKDKRLFQEGWGTVLSDFNNDGWLDLYMANGMAVIDQDSRHVTVGQDDALWTNQNGYFELRKLSDAYKLSSRGIVPADFNNDGLIDLLVTQNNGFVRLLINKTKTDNRWLGVVLTDEDKTSTGAKVTLKSTNFTQVKQSYMDSGYLSQGSSRIHFGIPGKEEIISLTVKWPDGTERSYSEFGLNRYVLVNKNSDMLPNLHIKEAHKKQSKNSYESILYVNKRLYIEILALIKDDERVTEELMLALNEDSSILRKEALKGLYLAKSSQLLPAIHNSLSDEIDVVRLYAIDLLKELELERSVSWLMVSLSDESADVRCSAAETFEAFFREEEAVIFRKYLAVPNLVLLLEDDVPDVKICAANALAESEHYRAVAPLIRHIDDDDIKVRYSVVRALGFIRDEKAIKPLTNIVSSHRQPAIVKAHALIALKRLNADGVDNLIIDIFKRPKDKESIENGVDILDALSSINDSILFDAADLRVYQYDLIKRACKLRDNTYCSRLPKDRGEVSSVATIKHTPDVSSNNKSTKEIKEVILTVNDKSLNVEKRKIALINLSVINQKVAKSMMLKIIDDDDPLIKFTLDQLKAYHNDTEVREVLWEVFRDGANSQELRLLAAKGLVVNEPEKVMSTLSELKQW